MKTRDEKRPVYRVMLREELCLGQNTKQRNPSATRIAKIQKKLLVWYSSNDRGYPWRRKSATKYQRVIAEVLLQRTKADVVGRMFDTFIAKYPSWSQLSGASKTELEDVLRPLGLWKRRAASMAALAQVMARNRGRFPKTRDVLETLPGVGQYVCNAILMFDQGVCQPLLDVNLARVLERLFGPRKLVDIRYDPYLQRLSLQIVQHQDPTSINWAFLDLSAVVCTIRSPKCNICPLHNHCCYASKREDPMSIEGA
jgi:A/G-specific adenine glycosylase